MRYLLTILAGLFIFSGAKAGTPVKPGTFPPAYLGKTLSGKRINLKALHGDVVVIDFWATWCHYCIREFPVWADMQTIAARKGLRMQVVAVDYEEQRHTFYEAVHILKPHVPHLIITSDPSGRIGKRYGVEGIPFMVMLHRNGKVAYVDVGYDRAELNTLVKQVNVLLSEPTTQKNKAPGKNLP